MPKEFSTLNVERISIFISSGKICNVVFTALIVLLLDDNFFDKHRLASYGSNIRVVLKLIYNVLMKSFQ